jgi:hypothetical protein
LNIETKTSIEYRLNRTSPSRQMQSQGKARQGKTNADKYKAKARQGQARQKDVPEQRAKSNVRTSTSLWSISISFLLIQLCRLKIRLFHWSVKWDLELSFTPPLCVSGTYATWTGTTVSALNIVTKINYFGLNFDKYEGSANN